MLCAHSFISLTISKHFTLPIFIRIPFTGNFKSFVPVFLLYRMQGDPSSQPASLPWAIYCNKRHRVNDMAHHQSVLVQKMSDPLLENKDNLDFAFWNGKMSGAVNKVTCKLVDDFLLFFIVNPYSELPFFFFFF